MTDRKLEDYTAEELQQFRAGLDPSNLTPEQKAGLPRLDAMIATKLAEEVLAKDKAASKRIEMARKLDARAEKLYPELRTKDSEFSKKVDEYLAAFPDKTDPAALLNAAHIVADELGVAPAQNRRETPDPERTGSGGDGKPADTAAKGHDFMKRTNKLAQLLQSEGVLDLSKDGVKDRILADRENLEREEL